MKKKLFLSSLLITGTILMANAQLSLKAGLNLSSMKYELGGENILEGKKNLPGVQFGAAFNIPLIKGLSIEPGLLGTTKGVRFQNDFGKGSVNLVYIQIPAVLKYSIGAGPIKAFLGVGPALNIGLTGRNKLEEATSGLKISESMKFSNDVDENSDQGYVKPTDFGLKATLGMNLSSFLLGIEYDLGLSNLNVYDFDYEIKNRTFSVVVGFTFGKK